MKNSLGFTLIEIMIVVVIISVLAAIAVPVYLNYVARSQVASVLAELNGARASYELVVSGDLDCLQLDHNIVHILFMSL